MMQPPTWFTPEAKKTVSRGYLLESEPNICYAWKRVANKAEKIIGIKGFADDLYEALYLGYIGLASPVLSNFGTNRGLSISCFANHISDSIDSIYSHNKEAAQLTKQGGGVGTYWGDVRAGDSEINSGGISTGVVPFMLNYDSVANTVTQGQTRRGNYSYYLPIYHGDILRLLGAKDHNGGDPRNYLDGNIAVVVPNWWIIDLLNGDKEKAHIWNEVLKTRLKTGSPYILFVDNVNDANPEAYKRRGLEVSTSNICTEITLFTDENHTFVCCLSSINVSRWFEFKDWISPNLGLNVPQLITYLLDAVLTDFINKCEELVDFDISDRDSWFMKLLKGLANGLNDVTLNSIGKRFFGKRKIPSMGRALRFAKAGRPIGIGTMGLADLYQQNMLPFSSKEAYKLNVEIHKWIDKEALKASQKLARKLGEPEWCKGLGVRHTHRTAIAPTKSNSVICNAGSQGIEPYDSNGFVAKQSKGNFIRKNRNLENLLEAKGYNTPEVWDSIIENNGSVLHLDFLTEAEKMVFLTAREINPMDLINQAADRQPFVNQSQSLNLFQSPYTTVKGLNKPIIEAWKKGVKSLYYLKSSSSTLIRQTKTCFIMTKPGCPYCDKAKDLLTKAGISYTESSIIKRDNPQYKTVPQIWLDGFYIGGYTELKDYLKVKMGSNNVNFSQKEANDCESCHA